MDNSIISQLGLTAEQTTILFKIEKHLTEIDIGETQNLEEKRTKQTWLERFVTSCNTFLAAQKHSTFIEISSLEDSNYITNWLQTSVQQHTDNKMFLSLMLLEATLFIPYFPLSQDEKHEKLKYSTSSPKIKSILVHFAVDIGFTEQLIERFRSSHASAIKGITGFWKKVAIGAGVGTILLTRPLIFAC